MFIRDVVFVGCGIVSWEEGGGEFTYLYKFLI